METRLPWMMSIERFFSNYHHFVFHNGKCLERQCELEVIHKLELKKRLPLPMFSMGNCVSLQIDLNGLYYILKEYENCHCSFNTLHEHPFLQLPTARRRWERKHFDFWIAYLFCIHEVIHGSKTFHKQGVILTADAVQVSIHYMKYIAPNPNPNAKKKIFKLASARINAKRQSKRKVGMSQGKVSQSMKTEEIAGIGLDLIIDEDEAVDMDYNGNMFLQDDEGEQRSNMI